MTKDRFIVQALGECWHEVSDKWDYQFQSIRCDKCGISIPGSVALLQLNPTLDTPDGFFWIWERMQKHERRWQEFLQDHGFTLKELNEKPYRYIDPEFINPTRFRDAVAEFFGWEEK